MAGATAVAVDYEQHALQRLRWSLQVYMFSVPFSTRASFRHIYFV